jgi:hypothetical protein
MKKILIIIIVLVFSILNALENGRLMLLYTYESNITDGWSNVHDDPENLKGTGFPIRKKFVLLYYDELEKRK